MKRCAHNDQFGICPLERDHSGEHAKVPHRTYSAAELAQAEARGVQKGLEMAAPHRYLVSMRPNRICACGLPFDMNGPEESEQWRQHIRSLQPIPQAPQATNEDGKEAVLYADAGVYRCPACKMPLGGSPASHLFECQIRLAMETELKETVRYAEVRAWNEALAVVEEGCYCDSNIYIAKAMEKRCIPITASPTKETK